MIKKFIKGALGILGIAVLCFVLLPTGQVSAADGDDYFWVGGTGNWSDYAAHWATTSGGGTFHGAAPNATNDVFFDANSFTGAGQTVTVDATAVMASVNFTGSTNSPTLTVSQPFRLYGSATFIAAMTINGANAIAAYSGSGNITTNGVSIGVGWSNVSTGTYTYLDGLALGGNSFTLTQGTAVFSNGTTVTCNIFGATGAGIKTLTANNLIVNCSSVNFTGTNITITANTATINSAGNFSSTGYDYNGATLNFTGATSTITGSNTFNTLGLTRAGVQTITFTDGTTQTVTNFTRNVGTQVKTLQGSGVAGWAITKAGGGAAYMDYISVSRSTGSPAATFIAGVNSTNGGNNTDWSFVADVTSGAETNVTFGAATLNGTITTNGTNATRRGFQYGTVSGALNLDIHTDGDFGTGAYSFNISGLAQNTTYYYRAYAVTAGITEYGAEGSLNTQPTAWGIMMLLPLIVAIGVVVIGLRVLASAGMQGYAVSVLFGVATYIMLQALIGIL